uniref:Uncharacterized protein n=1 Tax=Romanomermis culicivorax TaxID=13658 RepID=A0A915IDG8_ROMCU
TVNSPISNDDSLIPIELCDIVSV